VTRALVGRTVADQLGRALNQSFIVENSAGGGGAIASQAVARAAPDGYTLLVGGIFNMVMNKALVKNLTYEPLRDFTPLGYTFSNYLLWIWAGMVGGAVVPRRGSAL